MTPFLSTWSVSEDGYAQLNPSTSEINDGKSKANRNVRLSIVEKLACYNGIADFHNNITIYRTFEIG